MNKVIISLFILFAVIVFFSSLQKISHNSKANSLKLTPTIILEQITFAPSLDATKISPTLIPTITSAPVNFPQFKVTRSGEGSDN